MRYNALITEVHYGSVAVDADTVSEAIKKADEIYADGGIQWKVRECDIQAVCLDDRKTL